MALVPKAVVLVEVGPRDGLQNEPSVLSLDIKLGLITRLVDAGLASIEAGAFVSPQWMPQMADTADLLTRLTRPPGVSFPVLVPNEKGLDRALAAGAEAIAVFASASESFSRKNINCSIGESFARFAPVCRRARELGLKVRGYVSCALGCPYEGPVPPGKVASVAVGLADLGCDQISLADTIGIGTPSRTIAMIEAVATELPRERLAIHCHDTYGQALVNIYAALEHGITVIDCSIAGLGGCPYAPGAAGNVATEDVLYLLDGLGIHTGVAMDRLLEATRFISAALGRPPASRAARALLARSDADLTR